MDKLEEWEIKADIAAGWIYLMVKSNQRIHLTNIHDDPIKMWKALKSIYLQKHPAHTTQTKDTLPNPKEFAGHASLRSVDPSDPLTPLQVDADFDWNADTGATSHMTPHRHWIRNYTPLCIPIKLADNTVIYSAGVGTRYEDDKLGQVTGAGMGEWGGGRGCGAPRQKQKTK
jgi:hypothetical protein